MNSMRSILRKPAIPPHLAMTMTVALTIASYKLKQSITSKEKIKENCIQASKTTTKSFRRISFSPWSRVTLCEEKNAPTAETTTIHPASKLRRLMAKLYLYNLPLPRLLTKNDPAFSCPSRGLKQRRQDEITLRELENEAREATQSRDGEKIATVVKKITEVAYGKGVTPQMRQDFLMKYGCAAYTTQMLAILCEIAKHRGIVEIGAGNGQWARAITDYATKHNYHVTTTKHFEFVLPFDDMSSLPLNPHIYHSRTQPFRDYFYPHVRKKSHIPAIRTFEARGRVLLLVFPPPGPLALEAVSEYVTIDPMRNDVLVYVGEGRDGANANDDFFDFLETGGWVLLHELDVVEKVGNKGFEKLYVLKRVQK